MQASKVLLFFLFLLFIQELRAQTNFLKGYYITSQHDTISGYIDYRSEQSNYEVCTFKSNVDSKAVRLYPNDIIGFTVQGTDFYEKHSFKTRKDEVLFGFFRLMVRGKLSLLRYQSRYFVMTPANEVYEITRSSQVIETTNNAQGVEHKLEVDYYGLGILAFLMKDCEEITGAFLQKEYKGNPDFSGIFVKYNKCVGASVYKPDAIRIRPHFDIGIHTSLALTKLNLIFPHQSVLFGSDLDFNAGAYTSIFIPRVDENLRLVVEATVGKYKHYVYFTDNDTNNDLFVDCFFLKVPLLLRYTHHAFFIDIGIQNQYVLNQTLGWRVEFVQSNSVTTRDAQMAPFSKQTGILVGLGLNHKIAEHILRFSLRLSQSQASNQPNKPVFQSLEVLLAFQLTK